MLNYLWAGMILLGIIVAAFQGNLEVVCEGIVDSSKEAVELLFIMAGVVSMWNGMLYIAKNSGLIEHLTKKLSPFLRVLFPRLPKDHIANEYISANFIANILGLGWAATSAGLEAMKALEELEDDRRSGRVSGHVRKKGIASNEMCTFLILNISSLQLIPVNIIAYRSQYGSANPTAIIGAGVVATLISTLTACVYCKTKEW